MFAIIWMSALMVSASLAYEHPTKRFKPMGMVAGKRQGYALPAQGYAIAPAPEYSPSAGYEVPAAPSGYGVPAAPSGYGVSAAPSGYGVPAAPLGYGIPVAYVIPSYPTHKHPEEESKWNKFSGMIQKGIKGGVDNVEKGIKGSMNKQKENMENMKGMFEGMTTMKKEKIQEFKDTIKEHMKSKKQKHVEEPQSYVAAYPVPAYYPPAPVYSAPAYSPPAYAPPAYQEPAYEAPDYIAPPMAPEPYLPTMQSSYPRAPISTVPYPLASRPSAYSSSVSDEFAEQANFGQDSYPSAPSYVGPSAAVPVPVDISSPYDASPAVLLQAPSSFVPTAPSNDFNGGSAYGK